MDAVTVLADLQAALFAALAAGALWQWRKLRNRPAAYLSAAFVAIALVLVIARLTERFGALEPITVLTVALLATFPWILAAFAWSFAGRLPGWLRLAAAPVAGLVLWYLLAPPADGEDATPVAFLVSFLVVWTALSAAAAIRLIAAAGRFPLVRARMRFMAAGMLAMNAALLVSGATSGERGDATQLLVTSLVLVAGALFLAGFAPPLPLRLWWRRHATSEFEQLQGGLLTAVTPEQVAEVASPHLATMLGTSVALIGGDGTVLASTGLRPGKAEEVAALLVAGSPLDARTRAIPVGDAWLVVRSSVYSPVFGQDEQDLLQAFALHVRLAFERAELFVAQERAQEETEALLLGLTHDLRSPAVVIDGFAALLTSTDDPDERAEMVANIRESAAYLERLIDALLELSQVGRTRTEVHPIQLEELARQVARRLVAANPGISIDVRGAAPAVRLNPHRAEQVLDNLLGNAVKHGGRPDVRVEVTVTADPDGGVELVVEDDGRGIAAEEADRVFALFQRGQHAVGRGHGLGLGLVRRIVEASGGSLQLEPSDRGARFAARFPEGVVDTSPGARVPQHH